MRKLLGLSTALIAIMTLTACNTIQGVGRDITRTGEVIEDAVSG